MQVICHYQLPFLCVQLCMLYLGCHTIFYHLSLYRVVTLGVWLYWYSNYYILSIFWTFLLTLLLLLPGIAFSHKFTHIVNYIQSDSSAYFTCTIDSAQLVFQSYSSPLFLDFLDFVFHLVVAFGFLFCKCFIVLWVVI